MPHDAAFADAARPMRCVILRLALRPYSIGHEIILQQKLNPLLSPDFFKLPETKQRQALIWAVDICSQTWAENNSTPSTWLERWRHNRAWNKWEKATNALTEIDWRIAIADFINYRNAGLQAPKVEPTEGASGRTMGAPFLASLIQFLIQKMGKTEDRAYDCPLSLAKFHYYTDAESEGHLKIPNQNEMDFDEYCRKKDAEAAAKAKEAKCQP